jgi:hypothetical protein
MLPRLQCSALVKQPTISQKRIPEDGIDAGRHSGGDRPSSSHPSLSLSRSRRCVMDRTPAIYTWHQSRAGAVRAGSQKCERGMNAERRQPPQSATRVGAKERGGRRMHPTCGSGEDEEDVRLTCRLAAWHGRFCSPTPDPVILETHLSSLVPMPCINNALLALFSG